MFKSFAITLTATLLASVAAQAGDITGAGATFPAPVYAKWAESYKAQAGTQVNYQAIGSGGGIKQIKAKTVAFGASDKPLSSDDLKAAGLVQFPTVIGGIVPVTNLPGIKPGELRLNGDVLAKIFLGQVKKWNDPAIAALNPGKALPALPITVVHRSDGSGTSYVFTSYLSLVSADWKAKVGANTDVAWPAGEGGKGNDGVAALVKQTPGALGYVEYVYSHGNHLDYVALSSASGAYLEPNEKTFATAAAKADWAHTPGFAVSLLNQPGAAWPISSATFILVYEKQDDAAQGASVLKFFDWAYKNGDAQALQLDYVPLPASVKTLVRKTWAKSVNDASGKPVYVSQ